MNKKSIRVGVIGCGKRIQGVLKHVLANQGDGNIEIVGLYDPASWGVEAIQTELAPGATVHKNEKELLSREDMDWVMIGSWNCHHADQIIAALNAGKHIFCEKPLTTTIENCVRIQQARRNNPDSCFFFGLVLRYTLVYQKVKEVIDSGVLGDIISFEFNETLRFNHGGYIHGNWRRHREYAGTHLLEKCCHDFDLANWIIGSLPVKAASFGGKDFFLPKNRHLADALGHDENGKAAYQTWSDPDPVDPFSEGSSIVDNQVAILQYANGVRATFHTNCNAGIPERRMYILGSKATLRADAIDGTVELGRIGFNEETETLMSLSGGGGHYGGDELMGKNLAATMLTNKPPLAGLNDGIESAVSCLGVDQALDTASIIDYAPLWQQVGIRPGV